MSKPGISFSLDRFSKSKNGKQPAFNGNGQLNLKEDYQLLKNGVWIYFLLIIFEGALRKWFLPMLSTPLLIIRDPVALLLILGALDKGILVGNFYLRGMTAIGFISIFTALFFGHGNLWVALYGARIMLLHFPVMFIIGRIFNQEDVIKVGRVLMWITIPMTFLLVAQFFSPQSSFVNRGVGGNLEGAGFDGALGYFRPPGTFSFTSGNTQFYGLVAAFSFYFLLNPVRINTLVLIGSTMALFAAVPLSISRGLFFQIGVTLAFTMLAIARKPQFFGKLVFGIVLCLIAVAFLNDKSFFKTATGAFTSRFDAAGEAEGGLQGTLGNRYLNGLLDPMKSSLDQGPFGQGSGMGTNVGAMLLSGKAEFLIEEGEWGRLTGELGTIMGLLVIWLRLGFSWKIAVACYKRLKVGDLLPWLLLSYALTTIPQSQWGQPTSLGFSTLIGGLTIASLKGKHQKVEVPTVKVTS